MPTVTMRELKQNPHQVVSRVLTTAQPARVTSHGHDTGVVLQRAGRTGDDQFVTGAVLAEIARQSPLSAGQARAWAADIERAQDNAPVSDPWSAS